MNKTLYTLLTIMLGITLFTSCNNEETYAEQKERERGYINNFINGNCNINRRAIRVISESDFKAQGETTDTAKNEYVLFSSTGVYMQIVEKGTGELFKKLANGESADVLCRYTEYNINGDSLQSTNDNSFSTSTMCEKMTVRNTSGTFTASFVYGYMPNIYGTLSVPSGWLIPLRYINLGRLASDEDRLAHVKIIVPHNQGQPSATNNVYACFYDIVYQRGN